MQINYQVTKSYRIKPLISLKDSAGTFSIKGIYNSSHSQRTFYSVRQPIKSHKSIYKSKYLFNNVRSASFSNQVTILPFQTRSNISIIYVSPKSNYLIAVDIDGYAVFYHLPSRNILTKFNFHSSVTALQFSQDQYVFAIATGTKLKVYKTPPPFRVWSPLIVIRTETKIHSDSISQIIFIGRSYSYLTIGEDLECKIMTINKFTAPIGNVEHEQKERQIFDNDKEDIEDNELEKNRNIKFIPITLTGFKKPIKLAFFSQDLQRLFCLCQDGMLFIWKYVDSKSEAYLNQQKFQKRKKKGHRVDFNLPQKQSQNQNQSRYQINKEAKQIYYKLAIGRFILDKKQSFSLNSSIICACQKQQILVVGLANGTFSLFDINTLKSIHAFKISESQVSSVTLNSKSNWIAIGSKSEDSLCVWDWMTQSFIYKQVGNPGLIKVIEFSPKGGNILASAGTDDGKLKLWNSESGVNFASFSDHKAQITSLKFHPNGNILISCSLDGTVKAFDLLKYRNFRTFKPPQAASFTSVSIDISGDIVVAGSKEPYNIYVWSLKTQDLIDVLSGHIAPISFLAFQPNTANLISCSWDKSIRIWDIFTKKGGINQLQHTSELISFRFNPTDVNQIASISLNGQICLWDIQNLQLRGIIETKDDIWGGRLKSDFNSAKNSSKNKHLTAIVYSPNGEFLIAGGNSKYISLFDTRHRVLIHKILLTSNRSLQGILHKLNSKQLQNGGDDDQDAYLSDDDQFNRPAAIRLAGQKVKRKKQLQIRILDICFSKNQSEFAIATTEGIHLYSNKIQELFIPPEMSYDITVEQALNSAQIGQTAQAFDICMRLNDSQLMQKIFYDIVKYEKKENQFIDGLKNSQIKRILEFISEEMKQIKNMEYCIRFTKLLIRKREKTLKSQNKQGQLDSTLLTIRKHLSDYSQQFSGIKTAEENSHMLEFIKSKVMERVNLNKKKRIDA